MFQRRNEGAVKRLQVSCKNLQVYKCRTAKLQDTYNNLGAFVFCGVL